MRRLLLVVLSACFPVSPALAEAPVAILNGIGIDASALHDDAQKTWTDAGSRESIRDHLIAQELLWQAARAAGFDSAPGVPGEAGPLQRQWAIEAYVKSRIKVVEPSEQAVRARYDELLSRLGRREYRLSVIQTTDLESLREAERRIGEGSDFAHEARAHSRVASASGGELGWRTFPEPAVEGVTNGMPLVIAELLPTMRVGEISAPLPVGDGWVIVRLDATRKTLVPDYASVRDAVRTALRLQHVQAQIRPFLADLFRHAQVRKFD